VKPGSIPSSHYPDYFKLDLGIGEPTAHPLARALDDTLENWLALAYRRSLTVSPESLDEAAQRAALRAWGFKTGALSADKREGLFRLAGKLIRERTSLSAVETLSRLYFETPVHEIRRGLPYPKRRLEARVRFPLPLADTEARDNVLFVRLGADAPRELTEEFSFNAARLLPLGYRIHVASPARKLQLQSAGISIAKAIPLGRRKLECRISQK